jgi:predicted Zn finger-like uncharacterized protein
MNNTCPSCGALYAVTGKDIGRKLKCKKCGSALTVTVAGLEMEEPVEAVAEVTDENVEEAGSGEVLVVKGKKGKKDKFSSRQGGRGVDIGEQLAKVGGLSTILFGFGVFLVIFFTFMTKIGEAGTDRAYAQVQKLELEKESKKIALSKGKTLSKKEEMDKLMEDQRKIDTDYSSKLADALEDASTTEVNNRRGVWSDRWGTMFGFIFMAFGCIGYLRGQEPLTLRIVAGVILSLMMIIVLIVFTTSSVDKSSQRSSSSSMPGKSGFGGPGGGMDKVGPGGIPNFP